MGQDAPTLETRRVDLPDGHPCSRCNVRDDALCSVLDCDALAQFKKLGPTLRLGAGATLFLEGDPVSRVFTPIRGSLKLVKILPDGRRQIIGFKFPGDFLGISAEEEHRFTAELIEDCELCAFSRQHFTAFLREHPALEARLYQLAARELDIAQDQFVTLGRKSAAERVASFLLRLAERTDGAGEEPNATVDLPMSRADIADYLGLTKETVSRVLSALRARRCIRLNTLHEVEIVDRPALARLACGEAQLRSTSA